MTDELYEGLKKIYEDFFSQKNMLDEKKDYYTNDNEYQNYVEKMNELDSKIKTVSSLLNVFERQYFTQKYGKKNIMKTKKSLRII